MAAGAEETQKFVNKLETMNIADPKLVEFFKDEASEDRINRQLLTHCSSRMERHPLHGIQGSLR